MTSPAMLWNTVARVRLAGLTPDGFIGSEDDNIQP
jgi:hypothetical protein